MRKQQGQIKNRKTQQKMMGNWHRKHKIVNSRNTPEHDKQNTTVQTVQITDLTSLSNTSEVVFVPLQGGLFLDAFDDTLIYEPVLPTATPTPLLLLNLL